MLRTSPQVTSLSYQLVSLKSNALNIQCPQLGKSTASICRTWHSNKYTKHTQKVRYIMDRSHNCARLLFGLPSLSLFVLTDFPVCLINKRQSRAGQGWLSLLYQGKERCWMPPKTNCRTANYRKVYELWFTWCLTISLCDRKSRSTNSTLHIFFRDGTACGDHCSKTWKVWREAHTRQKQVFILSNLQSIPVSFQVDPKHKNTGIVQVNCDSLMGNLVWRRALPEGTVQRDCGSF